MFRRWMIFSLFVVTCSLFVVTIVFFEASAYEVRTQRYSYFLLDAKGQLVHSGGLPIASEGTYSIPVTIIPQKTAIVVMDPWIDMASDYLNSYFGQITEQRVVPLVYRAWQSGHKIVILTNDPTQVRYNTHIHPDLLEIIDGKQVALLYHQRYDDESFARWLKARNIDTLIYVGFASNQCVIGRSMGMIMMRRKGFRLFFIPEASAAVEMADTWESQEIHRATVVTISQWVGNLIDWDEHMEAMLH